MLAGKWKHLYIQVYIFAYWIIVYKIVEQNVKNRNKHNNSTNPSGIEELPILHKHTHTYIHNIHTHTRLYINQPTNKQTTPTNNVWLINIEENRKFSNSYNLKQSPFALSGTKDNNKGQSKTRKDVINRVAKFVGL